MANVFLGIYAIVTSLGLIFIKLGTNDGMPIKYIGNKLQFDFNFYIIAGVLMYGLSFLLYMFLISKNELGYIIPLTTALVYVLIFVSSYFIFHEVFTATKIAGILLIIGGLVCLNLGK
jgi:small multidrug resistance pump